MPIGNPGVPRGPNSPEIKAKKSASAKKRWDNMSPEVEIKFRKRKSAGMKKHWKKFTKEERHTIGMKGAIGRLRTRLKKLEVPEDEIEAIVREKYYAWLD